MAVFLFLGLPVGPVVGLLVGSSTRLPFMLGNRRLSGLLLGLLVWLFFVLLLGLLRGLSGSQIAEHLRIKPNQGIRSSGWNALYIGLVSMPFFVLLGGLL